MRVIRLPLDEVFESVIKPVLRGISEVCLDLLDCHGRAFGTGVASNIAECWVINELPSEPWKSRSHQLAPVRDVPASSC